MAYTNSGMRQLAEEVLGSSKFGDNGWIYTFSLSEILDRHLTTLTVYRKTGGIVDPKQVEIGHVDIGNNDTPFRDDKVNFLYNHVRQIVANYERAEMMAGMNVNIDQWYREQARREVEEEYAAILTSLGVNLSAYSTTGMDAIVNQQARLLKAQRENSPNVGFLASELSSMKHSFSATARQEAQRDRENLADSTYPGSLSAPTPRTSTALGQSRTREREERRNRQQAQERLDRMEAMRERFRNAARPRALGQYADYVDYEDMAIVAKPSTTHQKKAPIVEDKIRQNDLFEETGRKFRID